MKKSSKLEEKFVMCAHHGTHYWIGADYADVR